MFVACPRGRTVSSFVGEVLGETGDGVRQIGELREEFLDRAREDRGEVFILDGERRAGGVGRDEARLHLLHLLGDKADLRALHADSSL